MKLEYTVEIKGTKVDIVYKTSDENFLRNFLEHVIKTSVLEDLSIKIRGPPEYDVTVGDTRAFKLDTSDTLL